MTVAKIRAKTTQTQLTSYRASATRLLSALVAQNAARAGYDGARDILEDERRRLLLECRADPANRTSAEQREAAISRTLEPQARVMRCAREALRCADTELECARVQERSEREILRALNNDRAE